MSGLYRLTVTDKRDCALSGRTPCRYISPPQPLDELRALGSALLGGAQPPSVGTAVSQAIAGGRRTVFITPARPQHPDPKGAVE